MIPAAPAASLISARINWGIYVTQAVQSLLAGEQIPVDWCKGLADGAVYLSPLNADIAASGTQEAIDDASAKIISGELHVFSGPLSGAGVDFDGNPVTIDVPAGDYFHEQEEASAPSWNYLLPGCTVIE
jgi:basic membrane protein A